MKERDEPARRLRAPRLLSLLGAGLVLIGIVRGVSMQGRLAWVSGPSMEPTLRSGDLLWVDRRAYRGVAPERGDVVVASYRGEWIVKRVVGLPGERIGVLEGTVWVDGEPRVDGREVLPGPLTIEEGRLLSGRYALLGDNRSESAAVLVHAVVDPGAIAGRVTFRLRLWPFGLERVS